MEGLRGQFKVNGGWIDNQFTLMGAESLLRSAFWRLAQTWHVGLCASIPADRLTLEDVVEPTIGLNGYNRLAVPLTQANWPNLSQSVGEVLIESRNLTFPLEGPIDVGVNRLFITDGQVVIAVSTPFADNLQILSEPYQTQYRFFFR